MITDKKFQYAFGDLGIDPSRIESLLGYNEGGDRTMVQFFIEESLNEAAKICSVRAEYRIYKNIILDNKDKSIYINDINFNIQKIVFNQLKKSESVAVFVCTAGKEIGSRSRDVMAGGDPLKGFILDTIGSMVVDAAADQMQLELEVSVNQSGQKITNRYNPGYCGWSVGEQHKLFGLLPDNFCGIRLTESALMDPVKSVSGIIGIGEHVKYNKYTCSYCDMKDCAYRNLKDEKEERRKGSTA
jgi:hypothetical protein